MVEWLGLIYEVAKDIKNYLKWDEESKTVDREWLEKSGFGKEMENHGYKLYWLRPEKIESRKLDGYEIINIVCGTMEKPRKWQDYYSKKR